MALKRLEIDGYGQLEINNVAFRRTGAIEAQCELDETDFAEVPAENGMLLAVDNVKRAVRFTEDDEVAPIALNYTSEHMYDDTKKDLKNFALNRDEFLPRLGYLSIGDKITTNTLSYDNTVDATWTSNDKFKDAFGDLEDTPLYGTYCANGGILVSATRPTGKMVLNVIARTTMPDGQFGAKLQVAGL